MTKLTTKLSDDKRKRKVSEKRKKSKKEKEKKEKRPGSLKRLRIPVRKWFMDSKRVFETHAEESEAARTPTLRLRSFNPLTKV